MKTRYFKPRKDLEFSNSLLPQKVEGNKQYRWTDEGQGGHGEKYWRESWSSEPFFDILQANVIEVNTEAECIA